MRRFAKQLVPVLLQILKEDNEDNGELTMKILSEMLRSCKDECEEFALPFFEQIKTFFIGMPATVDTFFGSGGNTALATSANVSTCHLIRL